VLGARQRYDIKGWRKSLQRVAAFFFTRHDNSYAARTGRPDHVGVMVSRCSEERQNCSLDAPRADTAAAQRVSCRKPCRGVRIEHRRRACRRLAERAAAASGMARPSASRTQARHRPWPQRELVRHHTEFDRASSTPDEVIVIHYDTYRNLVAQG